MTIKFKLLAAFFVVIALLLATMFYSLAHFHGIVRQQLGNDLANSAAQVMAHVDKNIQHKVELLKDYLHTTPQIRELLRESNREFAQKKRYSGLHSRAGQGLDCRCQGTTDAVHATDHR